MLKELRSEQCQNLSKYLDPNNWDYASSFSNDFQNCLSTMGLKQQDVYGILAIILVLFIIIIEQIFSKKAKPRSNSDIEITKGTEIELKHSETGNEISSDAIRQKIDLAIAFTNMGEKSKAKRILSKLNKQNLKLEQQRLVLSLVKKLK